MNLVRWGILGTGKIASALAATLATMSDGRVVAVGSRTQQSADDFAERYGIERAHGTYDALIHDGEVDALYVAVTNELHAALTVAGLNAGKAVLCEKPLALNVGQAVEMVDTARREGRFLMEAMWMRFQPFFRKLKDLIEGGRIGEVLWVQADFGIPASADPEHRLFNPALGGGSLLDLGIYPISFAHALLGEPEEVAAIAAAADTGVDAQVGILLRHRGGAVAVLSSSLVADTGVEAIVAGSKARIRVHSPFHHSPLLSVSRRGETVEVFDVGYEGSGYRFEVEEVHRCLGQGLVESPRMPLGDSLSVMRIMDKVREQVGVRFPGE